MQIKYALLSVWHWLLLTASDALAMARSRYASWPLTIILYPAVPACACVYVCVCYKKRRQNNFLKRIWAYFSVPHMPYKPYRVEFPLLPPSVAEQALTIRPLFMAETVAINKIEIACCCQSSFARQLVVYTINMRNLNNKFSKSPKRRLYSYC